MKKSYFYFLYIISLLYLTIPVVAYAQSNNDNITQEIFVTGLAVPLSTSKAGVGLTTITNKQIEEMKPNTLEEILRKVPGMVIRENSSGKLTTLYLRGVSTGIALMIDGMPVNDSAGINNEVDLSSVPIDNIERIEIIKSPASASLGSSAMNGAINIITKKGGNKPLEASAQLQSSLLSQYFIGKASLYGSKGIVDYRINGSYLYDENISAASDKYEGNVENDPDAMGHFSAYLGLKPTNNLNSSFYIDYTDRTSDIDNCGGAGCDNIDYIQRTRRVSAAFKTNYIFKDIWEPSINVGYTFQNRVYGSYSAIKDDKNDIFDGHSLNVDFQNNVYIVDEFTLTAGLSYQYNQIYTRTGILESDKSKNQYAGYLQGTIDVFDSWWTTVIALRGQQDDGMQFQPLYRVSTVVDVKPADLQLKASVGNGAMAPSLYQQYDPEWGNPNLTEQESFSYEVGFTYNPLNKLRDNMLVIGASFFDSYYNNMISYGAYLDSNDGLIKTGFYNERKTHIYGIETDMNVDPIKYINFGINYTWMKTFNINGNPLARRPEHKVSAYVNIIPIKPLNINIGLIYSGESPATIYDNAKINDDYYLLNASISYQITDNIQIYLKGTNLTNTDYEEIAGYGMKGIEIFLGLKAKI